MLQNLTTEHIELILLISTIFWASQQVFKLIEQVTEWGVGWLKRIQRGETDE